MRTFVWVDVVPGEALGERTRADASCGGPTLFSRDDPRLRPLLEAALRMLRRGRVSDASTSGLVPDGVRPQDASSRTFGYWITLGDGVSPT